MRINMYSTPMDGSCGIGMYTKILINKIKEYELNINILPVIVNRYSRNPLHFMKKIIELSRNCDIAHIQFEYDLFGHRFPITGFYIPIFYLLLYILSRNKSFKIVTTMHNVWDIKNPPKLGVCGAIYAFIINKFVTALSDAIIVLSKIMEDRLINQYNIPRYKIYTLPHGVDKPIILDKKTCKKKLGINPEKSLVTILGYIRLDNNVDTKGHDLFIKAAKYFEDEAIFLIAGDGQTIKEKNYLNKLKEISSKNVIFHGFVKDEEIPIILNATDVMVLPYRKIEVSGILNISLAYQVPTITSDLPYFKNIKEKYDCIYLIKKDDLNDLIKAIELLIKNKSLRKKLKRNCKLYLLDNSYDIVVKKIINIYKNLI